MCEEGDLKAISNVVSGGINNKILGQTIGRETLIPFRNSAFYHMIPQNE